MNVNAHIFNRNWFLSLLNLDVFQDSALLFLNLPAPLLMIVPINILYDSGLKVVVPHGYRRNPKVQVLSQIRSILHAQAAHRWPSGVVIPATRGIVRCHITLVVSGYEKAPWGSNPRGQTASGRALTYLTCGPHRTGVYNFDPAASGTKLIPQLNYLLTNPTGPGIELMPCAPSWAWAGASLALRGARDLGVSVQSRV